MNYQGWTNEQTWCVALTIDNDRNKLETLLADLKKYESSETQESVLRRHCREWRGDIFHMATWAWPEAYQDDQVNWNELLEHYKTKKVEASKKAEALRSRLVSIQNNTAIQVDNPDAKELIQAKIDGILKSLDYSKRLLK